MRKIKKCYPPGPLKASTYRQFYDACLLRKVLGSMQFVAVVLEIFFCNRGRERSTYDQLLQCSYNHV